MKSRSDSFRVLRGIGAFAAVICTLCFILLLLVFPGNALASNVGYLDPSFGAGGIVKIYHAAADDMAVQADGKIVVAGGANGVRGLGRFLPDGSPDTGFGVGGWLSSGWGYSLAVQPDGRIVTVGGRQSGGDVGPYDIVVVERYNSDGTYDTSFGTGGVAETYIGPGGGCTLIQLQPDGKIVVAGEQYVDPDSFRLLIRYLPDGTLDSSFGTGGILLESSSGTNDLAIQSDGRILVLAGFTVTRYNEDGSLDTSFGTGGVATYSSSSEEGIAYHLSLLADGRILVSGFMDYWSYSPNIPLYRPVFLARMNSDGSMDTSFGTGGRTSAALPGSLDLERPLFHIWDTLVQPDGKIVVAGWSEEDAGTQREIVVARFLADGSPDLGFHRTGWFVLDIYNNDEGIASAVALQSDGKIVVAGYSLKDSEGPYGSMVLLRYLAEDTTAPATAVSMGPGINNTSLVKVLDFAFAETGSFTAFDSASVRYGARVALGDIDGDGADEVIAAKGEGLVNNSEVKAFEVDGTPLSGANFVAFSSTYRGGANVAAGDLDGDGKEEIIVGSSEGRPLIRIFSYDPWAQVMVDRGIIFNPFPGQACGVNVTAADLDGDGVDELITAPDAKSAAPSVAVWSMEYELFTLYMGTWVINPYTGSFSVPLAADLLMSATGGGAALAATGGLFAAGTGAGGGEAELYKGATVYDCRIPLGDTTTRQRSGIELAAGDADGDGLDEILLALGRNSGSSTGFSVYDGLCGWETDIGPVFPGAAYGARLAVGSTF